MPVQLPALKMFGKLFFIKDPESMVKVVIEGLYPAAYLEAPDDRGSEASNQARLVKEFLRRYELTRRQPMMGRICQTAAALYVHKTLCSTAKAYASADPIRRGHYCSPERLLEINQLPKVAILTGDQDAIIDPQRSHDLAGFIPASSEVRPRLSCLHLTQMLYTERRAHRLRRGWAVSASTTIDEQRPLIPGSSAQY